MPFLNRIDNMVTETKARLLSESDISDAASESQKAGYGAVADRVFQMTGFDMRNADDRTALCDHYDVDPNKLGSGSSTYYYSKSEFENALRSYNELAVDEKPIGDGKKVDVNALPTKDEIDVTSKVTYDRVAGNVFANEIYKDSLLDINSAADNKALQERIGELEVEHAIGSGNPMLYRASEVIDYAKDHHVDIDKDFANNQNEKLDKESVGSQDEKVDSNVLNVGVSSMNGGNDSPNGFGQVDFNDFMSRVGDSQINGSFGFDDMTSQQVLDGANSLVDSLDTNSSSSALLEAVENAPEISVDAEATLS